MIVEFDAFTFTMFPVVPLKVTALEVVELLVEALLVMKLELFPKRVVIYV